ncbi:LysR family transcriptional regulator [Microlunatus endophyticus]|uniref:LysR family transcriptional regulator n=2 Tax=Microlunatus endophyticus TaxID=1716077 RepID=A0A917S4V6_9ACTN|nr:LysR family transcriptional regulator [Microlunatus endophyticus]
MVAPRDLELPWLRTFLQVADLLSFSAAARRLGLSQSAVSQHIRRLEQTLGVRLLVRDTHSVTLTAEGESLTGVARSMLELNDDAFRSVESAGPRGRVRFGVSEDFALSRLPDLLRRFRSGHPGIDLELTVGLSEQLHRRLRARELDLVLVKRSPDNSSDAGGARLVFTDTLVWVGSGDLVLDHREPVPLIVYPPPSVTRDRAVLVLERADRGYRTVCTSGSLSGLRAAALAGLGVMPFSRSLIPAGLVEIDTPDLPRLGSTDFVLITRRRTVPAATRALIDAVLVDHRTLYERS